MNWSYVAGFFDGEGNIAIYDYERKRYFPDRPLKNQPYTMHERSVAISMSQKVRIFVNMTQLDNGVLNEIHKFLINENIVCQLQKANSKDIRRIQFSSRASVKLFLEKVMPYLIVKKPKAEIALRFLNGEEVEMRY